MHSQKRSLGRAALDRVRLAAIYDSGKIFQETVDTSTITMLSFHQSSKQTPRTKDATMRISIPVKDIVLTSIANKGIEQTKADAQRIADDCFAKKASVMVWIRKVEKGVIAIR